MNALVFVISLYLVISIPIHLFFYESSLLSATAFFSHLDNDKKQSLSREIESLDSQAFMTGIDKSDFMTFNKDSCIINLDSN